MSLIALVIWILVMVLIMAALLGVAKAVLALPVLADYQPWARVVYALIALIVVLAFAEMFMGGALSLPPLRR